MRISMIPIGLNEEKLIFQHNLAIARAGGRGGAGVDTAILNEK